ncbi:MULTISPECIES: 1,2-phenylacetyl-CoA epoxidase subunit PaaC [Sutcliffiella]|uniref:1,2-phenylacetyl-CoA epoxidase subunit PaaC n=1 Tax=Sutcliffiella TaxID=2837511 RepID=UPI000A055C6E|nr:MULTISPECIES: 1,2-phenylacetyl-CoA epoxidase subunit PaaC [Sutcliffiella]MED4018583.1 phenylacetate-CoA oxygenase subunit PaaC [Sutcliffiella cohnii]WBL13001.1 phenylacetate-CoA oxygenase subunit PaaC [Sutcliffiella sp. NC1]
MIFSTAAEAVQNEKYKQPLIELLYQLADDDFILAYRGSEWLGLAPHIEEDVAFSSINQDTMGHASMFYQLLEDLNEGPVDCLAHARPANERLNAVLLEMVNGPGTYLIEPKYDWAFTVVRHYFYTVAKKVKIESLKNSSYEPLKHIALKINMELYYHLLHWKTWFKQLCLSNDDAKKRMIQAINTVIAEFDGVLSLGALANEMQEHQIIEGEDLLRQRWMNEMKNVFSEIEIPFPLKIEMKSGNGRLKEHTEDLTEALKTLSEVYRTDPAASW